jgi:hypothetical protein
VNSCSYSFEKDLRKILGLSHIKINNKQEFSEWKGFQGDGFILEIYDLSEETVNNFDNLSLKRLPNKKEENKKWRKHDWYLFPIDSSYNEIFIMCLNYHSNSEEINCKLKQIKQLMRTNKFYCSFYYNSIQQNINSVQLFLLDVSEYKLYVIDQQL